MTESPEDMNLSQRNNNGDNRLATSKTMYDSNTRKNREEELVDCLSIPKTTSLYTKREPKKETTSGGSSGGGLTPEPEPTGRKNSKAEIFRLANSLTLQQEVKADPVEFIDGSTSNKLRFSPSLSAGRGISYHVNGSPRPDIGTIVFDARGPMLRFVDIFKGCHLPSDTTSHQSILSKLKKLADETGVWNNIPIDGSSQKIIFTQTSQSDIIFCQSVSKPHRLKVLEPDGCYYIKGLFAKNIDSKTALIGCSQGSEWMILRDERYEEKLSKLQQLCDKLGVSHKFGDQQNGSSGKIWVTSESRKCIRAVAVYAMRTPKVGALSRSLLRELTKWCGTSEPPMRKSNSLHILVVLWGYSDMVESRHVRCSQSSVTPSDVHLKLTYDKPWQDARTPTTTWNTQAVYWLGDSNVSSTSFKPKSLDPNQPLTSQGFQPGSGLALHIVCTKDTDRLSFFRKASGDLPRKTSVGSHSSTEGKKKKKNKHKKDCTVM
eukprot:TRINITY_DN33781_c0_g1_i1.p1 TRINITY_DN33781_c0_g1~~TRINITY_DN33781_c0_g1_i1.p1  ORF type:complete len:515 (+),score=88.30 TRINITY_DN33781_c0_g1_i1:80-1546(+)